MNLNQSDYLASLLANINIAKQISPRNSIELAVQFPIAISKQVSAGVKIESLAGVEHAIYIVRVAEPEKKSIAQVKEMLIGYKSTRERSCPKINKHNSPVLYVGSSTTGLLKRLNQHFGFGPAKTYALQLQHWFKGGISIQVMDYADTTREILQIVEDAISSELLPMFGKQGGNNK